MHLQYIALRLSHAHTCTQAAIAAKRSSSLEPVTLIIFSFLR